MNEVSYLIPIAWSLFLSFIVGTERELQHKVAGIRTCMLVTAATTIFTLIPRLLVEQGYIINDASRLPAYVISGVGFIGAGVIWKGKNHIEGVTTCGTLFALVALGMLCALNCYLLASVTAITTYLILKIKYIEHWFLKEVKITWTTKQKKLS